MIRYLGLLFSGVYAFSLIYPLAVYAGSLQPVCSEPPLGLHAIADADHVDARQLAFFEDSEAYRMSVFSGFAPQRNVAGSPFCIRYEAANQSAADILAFWWKHAGIRTSRLTQGSMLSLIKSAETTRPTLSDTKLYLFKNTTLNTKAFVAEAPARNFRLSRSRAPDRPAVIPVQWDAGSTATDVGGTFSIGGAVVDVRSEISRQGDEVEIAVHLVRNNEDMVRSVQAPFLLALAEASHAGDFLPLVAKLSETDLPLSDNAFFVTSRFPAMEFHVIDQPVTFQHGESESCFMVPIHSPVVVPEGEFTCEPSRSSP